MSTKVSPTWIELKQHCYRVWTVSLILGIFGCPEGQIVKCHFKGKNKGLGAVKRSNTGYQSNIFVFSRQIKESM
jgi:hypothetical protein